MSNALLSSSSLFTNPSFLKGSARLADLFAGLDKYNYKSSEVEADTEALKRDWSMIGFDIAKAIELYEQSDTISKKSSTES